MALVRAMARRGESGVLVMPRVASSSAPPIGGMPQAQTPQPTKEGDNGEAEEEPREG